MLSTVHRQCDFQAGDPNCIAKFMPCFDRPYHIKSTNTKHSTVILDLPGLPNIFPVFHTLEIQPFTENYNTLFPSRALVPTTPVTINDQQDFFIDKIVDKCRCRKRTLCICWQGEGPEGDLWLPVDELKKL